MAASASVSFRTSARWERTSIIVQVIRTQRIPVRRFRTFGIEIVSIETLNVLQHFAIVVIAKPIVGLLAVPCVKRMVANHVQGRIG